MPIRVPVQTLQSDPGKCPSAGDTEAAVNVLVENTTDILRGLECSGPGWTNVALVDMSDPTTVCPSGLREDWYTYISGATAFSPRTCGRTGPDARYCYSTTFPVSGQEYNRVCGRVRGYQFIEAYAFNGYTDGILIDGPYVSGVSLTHGNPRQHIWTFAGAISDAANDQNLYRKCPCTASGTPASPPFIGNDYFCESGLNTPVANEDLFYSDDPLWDGNNCPSGNTCCGFSNPPWFFKTLPNPTSDDIELRLCVFNNGQRESTSLDLIELYVQ